MTQSEVLEQFETNWQLALDHNPALVGNDDAKRQGWDLFTTDHLLKTEIITQEQYDALTNPFE